MNRSSLRRGRRAFAPSAEVLDSRLLLSQAATGHLMARPAPRELAVFRDSRGGPQLRQAARAVLENRSCGRVRTIPARPAGPLALGQRPGPATDPGQAGPRRPRLVRLARSPVPLGPTMIPLVTRSTPENAALVVQAIVDLTNHARAGTQAPPLTESPALTAAAEGHSRDMAAADTLAHTLPGARLPSLTDRAGAVHYRFTRLGENIAYNQADASSVVASWMSSPAHRENLLDPSFTEIGIGIAWNRRGEPYYTMMLGRPA